MNNNSRTSPVNLKSISVVLVLVALAISAYLSYVKISDTEVICAESATFNCNDVQKSRYGAVLGIPVAYLGLATNIALLALLLLEDRNDLLQEHGLMLTFGLVLLASLYSVYLIYIQASVLGTYCMWCLAHEAVILVLFVVTLGRVWPILFGED